MCTNPQWNDNLSKAEMDIETNALVLLCSTRCKCFFWQSPSQGAQVRGDSGQVRTGRSGFKQMPVHWPIVKGIGFCVQALKVHQMLP